jgi:hypothetical protein
VSDLASGGKRLADILRHSNRETMTDPNLGTWELNLATSRFDPGPPPLRATEVIEPWDTDGVKMTLTLVVVDGTRFVGVVHAHYDGKDSPIANFPIADTIAYSRVDADTLAYTVKKDGRAFDLGTIVVSNDAKTRTVLAAGANANGQTVNDVRVFDRQ